MGLTWRRFGQRPGTASHLEYVPECLRMLGGGGGGAVEDGHVVPLLLVRELRVALRSTYAKTIPPVALPSSYGASRNCCGTRPTSAGACRLSRCMAPCGCPDKRACQR